MTQSLNQIGESVMPDYHARRDAAAIQGAEQMWAEADAHLAKIIAYVHTLEEGIYAEAQNSDTSVLYDWLKGYVQLAVHDGGDKAHDMTILMCCAAITKLMRRDRTDADAKALAHLEEETGNDDHH